MARSLTLELPDELYTPLRERAERAGQTPEEIVMAWLEATLRASTDDHLIQLSGAFASDHPNISDRHDEYLGQAQAGESRDETCA